MVVGGGLLGTATAYHLVSAGARTLLVDRADPGRATDAGAGIISPETNSRDPEVWFELAVACGEYYPGFIDRLQGEQGADTGYARCGQLVVAVSDISAIAAPASLTGRPAPRATAGRSSCTPPRARPGSG